MAKLGQAERLGLHGAALAAGGLGLQSLRSLAGSEGVASVGQALNGLWQGVQRVGRWGNSGW